jgi:SSS family solute:Na+ symporter
MPPLPLFAVYSPRTLSWPDYLALAVYFALNLGIGWWSARRRQSGANDFFLGGGRVTWWAASISFFATNVSSVSFMALPAYTYMNSWIAIGSGPAQAVAGVAVGVLFVGLLRRLESPTIFGYLERRFDRRVRLLGAGLAVLLKIFGRMSVVMLLPALALSTVTGLNVYLSILLMGVVTTIYSMEGGFEAVVWTDVLQVIVMIGGLLVALWFVIAGVPGGIAGVMAANEAADKFRMVSWEPTFSEPTIWVFLGMFVGSTFSQMADQPLMQRAFAAKNERDAKRTVIVGGLIALPSPFLFFFFGSALYAFYQAHPERLAPGLPNDSIVPYFIVNELPPGVVGFIIASLFAAAMGALSSAQNSMAAIVVSDFWPRRLPAPTPAKSVRIAKLVTVLSGALAIGTAMWIASLNVASLWDQILRLLALVGGGFPGVFGLGLLTRRANAPGVIIGALSSIAITWYVQTFTSVTAFAHAFTAVSSCLLIGYVASLMLSRIAPPTGNLRGLTVWDLPRHQPPNSP